MNTYHTGNPPGSQDPRDLFDNSGNLDQFMLSQERTYPDRLGVERLTLAALENATPDAIAARDVATSAADVAVLARDASIAAAGPLYATEAEGRAAVANGETFKVQGMGDVAANLFRRIDATSSTLLASFPSSKAVSALRDLIFPADSAERAFDFADKFDQLIATLFSNGTFATRALQLLGSDLPVDGGKLGLAVQDALGFIPVRFDAQRSWLYGLTMEPSNNGSVALLDRHGFILFYVGSEGVFGSISNEPAPAQVAPALERGAQLRTDVMHVLINGQSLSRGRESIPAVSLAQNYQNVMLAGGVKARPADGAYNASALVPLVESTVGSEGETPVSGCLNALTRRAVAGGSSADRWVFLGTSSGQGGSTVEQLAPGGSSGRYEQTLQIIRDTKSLCNAKGKSYSVWAMCWYQGESDYTTDSNDRWGYDYVERWLTKLWQSLRTDAAGITGQCFAPYLFTYQVSAHRRNFRDAAPIALAQWRASSAFDDVVLAAPCYIFPTSADNLHLTSEGSWLMGEYTARAMYQTMIRRSGKWRPLEPIAVDWQPGQIKVKFHVPAGELVIDNALCADYVNAGFVLRDGSDAVIAGGITAVAVTAYDEITITTSAGVPADATLTYARGKPGDPAHSGPVTGARGNVRDTAGLYDKATSPLGNTFALHNACVMFEFSKQSGF